MSDELRVELKNVQSMRGDETPAFSATLYLDGKKVGYVRSEGSGGPPFVDWIDPKGKGAAALARWESWCREKAKAVYAEWGTDDEDDDDAHPGLPDMSEETAVFALYEDYEERRYLKRQCRRKTLFRVGDEKPGEWRVFDRPYDERLRAHIREKYGPDCRIANEELR